MAVDDQPDDSQQRRPDVRVLGTSFRFPTARRYVYSSRATIAVLSGRDIPGFDGGKSDSHRVKLHGAGGSDGR